MGWLKQLLCSHKWKHATDITFITARGRWVETLHECEKCGKLRQK